MKSEILVGKSCLICNSIITEEDKCIITDKTLYCNECFKWYRNEINKEIYRRLHPLTPKYCIDCNVLLPTHKWRVDRCNRCSKCQSVINYGRIKEYGKIPRKITVALTCINCSKIIITHSSNTKYCKDCLKERNNIQKLIYSKLDGYQVAVTCIKCGDIVPSTSKFRRYCDFCRKIQDRINREKCRK